MASNSIGLVFFFGMLAFVVGTFVFKMVKYGGFKAAMFGAPIERTLGEVEGSGSRMITVTVRVHALGGHVAGKDIGLEFVAKSFASYQMMPVALSAAEARKLASLLQNA